MKNFKIAMILVAAVAFFCSCGEKTVTVTMTSEVATYDLSSADTLPISIACSVKADAGINTLEVTKTIKNGDDVVKTVALPTDAIDFAGKTEVEFDITETLKKADLVAGYTIVYDVTAADKKDNSDAKSITITITETATPLSANWSADIVLSTDSWATYNGTNAKVEDETIGVKCLGKNTHKDYNMYATPTVGASWVFVESAEGLTTNEALIEAYNSGEKVNPGDRTMFGANDEGKANNYAEKFFISKNKDGEYLLVDYVAGRLNTGAQTNPNPTGIGNVMVLKYKKAETATPAAK